MKQIEQIEWNGYSMVSLFSGCGGSCLGYRQAGYKVLWANEFIREAAETYRANHPGSLLDTRDIRTIAPRDVLSAVGLKSGQLDLLDGSPPCSSFSEAGRGTKDWGKVKGYSNVKQRTDDLFFEYIRMVDGLRPKVFVAENVPGLIHAPARSLWASILSELKSLGYTVGAQVIDAALLGVPQARKRLFVIGVRSDIADAGYAPAFPNPLPYFYAVRDVLPYIKSLRMVDQPERWRPAALNPAGTVVAIDGRRKALQSGYFSASVIETDDGEKRRWTIDELKVISSFPADFILTGDFADQWERIGRAVPPKVGCAIGKVIHDKILSHLPKEPMW